MLAAICLLEAADRAEASVHGLARGIAPASGHNGSTPRSRRFTPRGGTPQGDTAMALAGAWLRSRGSELVAPLGADALRELAGAQRTMAEGWRREAQDLYDAGRSPERCLETARQRGGALGSLAASLNATAEGATERVEPLRRFGLGIGTAALIAEDIEALTAKPSGTHPLGRGAYSLPVAYALEANPKLASRIGGAIGDDAASEVAAQVVAAGGIERASEESSRLAAEAMQALEGIEGREDLIALAQDLSTTPEVVT